jgi:hypothetical protein
VGVTPAVLFWRAALGAENAGEVVAARWAYPMCKVALFLGFAAVCGAFPLAPLFSDERAGGVTGLLFAAGLFTIAIAAVVRK